MLEAAGDRDGLRRVVVENADLDGVGLRLDEGDAVAVGREA